MAVNPIQIGRQIHALRRSQGLTQNQLGERMHVSFQAVSKWERGETLPDTPLLPDLAAILGTTVDNILSGGEKNMKKPETFIRTATVAQMREGIDCFDKIGELLGKGSFFYKGAVGGVSVKIWTDFEESLGDPYLREAMVAEAAAQAMMDGTYFDPEDLRTGFQFPHWTEMALESAKKYGIMDS